MNAGIVILKDGTPCIVYDDKLPFPVKHVEFCRDDFILSLVYDAPGTSKLFAQKSLKFPHPLDPPFARLLAERGHVAVAKVEKGQISDIRLFFVRFKGQNLESSQ